MSLAADSRPILVVEDDEATREAECLLLRGEGYEVASAANGREALDRLRQGLRPRLILLDLLMPVLDGYGFRAEQLGDPRLRGIPVVVCSGAPPMEGAGSLRPAALLLKPVEPERLAEAVRSVGGETRPGVLVAEAEPCLQELLRLALEREGFAVWAVPSGRAAIRFYRCSQDRIGVVLLDAGQAGPETLAALRRIDPDVRAVLLSDDASGSEDLLGMGAAAVLQKPFDLEEVGRAVGRALACPGPEREGAVCLSVRREADLPSVLDPLAEAMTRLGYPARDVFGVRLALEEALVNALRHGNRGDPSKRARVRYRVEADEVWAEVEDEGQGFDPARVADPLGAEGIARPSGRGLLLIRHYLDSARYNEKGNAVTLFKKRSGPAAGG